MTTLALVGCGKMGGALLHGWLQNPEIKKIYVLEPMGLPEEFEGDNKISAFTETRIFNEKAKTIDALVLAVKPQIMDHACAGVLPVIKPGVLVMSIAAGKKLESYADHFGAGHPVVRVMPNTPAAVGEGISVAIGTKSVTDKFQKLAEDILGTAGKVEWVGDEDKFDAVTAVSGSGPAYVFLLMEVMTAAAIKQGLEPAFAERLARQTVIGAAALAAHEYHIPAGQLRQNVTSPGGTTAAALEVLMNGSFQKLFDDAIAAATKRGRELGS